MFAALFILLSIGGFFLGNYFGGSTGSSNDYDYDTTTTIIIPPPSINTPPPKPQPKVVNCPRTYQEATATTNSSEWNHGTWTNTTENSGNIIIHAPTQTRVGDYLFLFLSRSDDYLPLEIHDWTRGAECFKSENGQKECMAESDCIEKTNNGEYCLEFNTTTMGIVGRGLDLATVMFYRKVVTSGDDSGCWPLQIEGVYDTTTWAIVTAIPNVNDEQPIRNAVGRSCDGVPQSVFPNVDGISKNDVLLLSQAFDDTAELKHFQSPNGTELLGFTNGYDDAGFLYGTLFDNDDNGESTGEMQTNGPGTGARCKDALLSVVVNIDT